MENTKSRSETHAKPSTGPDTDTVSLKSKNKKSLTVHEAGLLLCHECHQLLSCEQIKQQTLKQCPRCGAGLESRLHNSMVRTWALLIAAAILFIPANIYPIMVVDSFAGEIPSSIMKGIVIFFQSKDYFIAFIIFVASIVVPAFKLVGMAVILLAIQRKSQFFYQHRSLMFQFIQFIGRWSMLDIFVIAIMVAMVDFGAISTIHAGPAATSFAAVVVITMYAAVTFDPRLIWDD